MQLKNRKLKPVLKNKKLNDMLQAALQYAKRGWGVFPVYGVDESGNCACGNIDCEHQGKHPSIKNGHKDATDDINIIKPYWEKHPDSNIGIATGKDSFVVLDIDGKEGRKSLAALEKQYGKLPITVTVITGNGKHYWFKSSVVVKNSTSKVGEKVDVRGNGGYIIAPPSNHYSGQTYRFQDGRGLGDVDIADVPEWLLDLMLVDKMNKIGLNTENPKNLPVKLTNSSVIPLGQRNDTLFRFGCYLRSKDNEYNTIYSQLTKMNTEKCQPPLDSSEIDTIIKSCMRYSPGGLQESLQYTNEWLTANSNVNFDKILSDNNLLKSLAIISKEDAQHFAQIIMLLKKKIF